MDSKKLFLIILASVAVLYTVTTVTGGRTNDTSSKSADRKPASMPNWVKKTTDRLLSGDRTRLKPTDVLLRPQLQRPSDPSISIPRGMQQELRIEKSDQSLRLAKLKLTAGASVRISWTSDGTDGAKLADAPLKLNDIMRLTILPEGGLLTIKYEGGPALPPAAMLNWE